MLRPSDTSEIRRLKRRYTTRESPPRRTKAAKPDPLLALNALPAQEFAARHVPADKLIYTSTAASPADIGASSLQQQTYDITFHTGPQLSEADFQICFELIERTSRKDYEASSGGWDAVGKRKEMREVDMRYLIVRTPDRNTTAGAKNGKQSISAEARGHEDENREQDVASSNVGDAEPSTPEGEIAGFLSYLLDYDSEPHVPVLYIMEIHLSRSHRGVGLGKHLMDLASTIALNVPPVKKCMLTVYTSNATATNFYKSLRYRRDPTCPAERRTRGRTVPLEYEILALELEERVRKRGNGSGRSEAIRRHAMNRMAEREGRSVWELEGKKKTDALLGGEAGISGTAVSA